MAYDTLELLGPGITWHVIDGGVSNLYSHQLSHDGRLIYTPLIGLKKTHISPDGTYHSFALFTADNSIGSPIYGFMGGVGVEFFKMMQAGFVGGGYIQNNEDFYAQGIVPYSMFGDTNAFVPLLGLEINFKFYTSDTVFVGFNNIITPIITNHSISVGLRF